MRKWSFILYVLGMVCLILIYMLPGFEVESLDGMELNERVIVSGKVISERGIYSGTKLLELDSGIRVVCECVESFEGREVRIEGFISEYNGNKQVSVERIELLN
jgi:DNA/RNA endonuclease YhcR with UshA esterase domain